MPLTSAPPVSLKNVYGPGGGPILTDQEVVRPPPDGDIQGHFMPFPPLSQANIIGKSVGTCSGHTLRYDMRSSQVMCMGYVKILPRSCVASRSSRPSYPLGQLANGKQRPPPPYGSVSVAGQGHRILPAMERQQLPGHGTWTARLKGCGWGRSLPRRTKLVEDPGGIEGAGLEKAY